MQHISLGHHSGIPGQKYAQTYLFHNNTHKLVALQCNSAVYMTKIHMAITYTTNSLVILAARNIVSPPGV